ncbi:1-acyl-sn-glycerol-3-phosphate acyltransferase [bacterium]|nr:1-acyl-sn-glycerol-3-phosphate acyltransferase [bacterium]
MKRENFTRRYQSEYNWYRLFSQFYAVWCICKPFWALFYKIEIIGRENIPKDRKIIPAANHISYFDPFLVFMATWRPVAFMAKKELFERSSKNTLKAKILDNWRIGWLDRLGAFSVNREKLEVSTIKTAKDALKTKRWTLGIFPQGGIRKNKKIENVNKGFAVLAKMVGVDILPIGITGCESYNWDFWHKSKITIRIGKPISSSLEIDEIQRQWAVEVARLCDYECVLDQPNEVKEVIAK